MLIITVQPCLLSSLPFMLHIVRYNESATQSLAQVVAVEKVQLDQPLVLPAQWVWAHCRDLAYS